MLDQASERPYYNYNTYANRGVKKKKIKRGPPCSQQQF